MHMLWGTMVLTQVRKLNYETIAQGHPNIASPCFSCIRFFLKTETKNFVQLMKMRLLKRIYQKYVYQMV